MYQTNRVCWLFLLVFGIGLEPLSAIWAQQPAQFPWGSRSVESHWVGSAANVYQVLPGVLQDKHHRAEAPTLQFPVPVKHAYSYGWFGSNPSHHWGRHFGNSKSYTQWSRR